MYAVPSARQLNTIPVTNKSHYFVGYRTLKLAHFSSFLSLSLQMTACCGYTRLLADKKRAPAHLHTRTLSSHTDTNARLIVEPLRELKWAAALIGKSTSYSLCVLVDRTNLITNERQNTNARSWATCFMSVQTFVLSLVLSLVRSFVRSFVL